MFFIAIIFIKEYNEFENDFQIGGIMTYNTKQKEKILDAIKNYNSEFTINDIYNKLNKEVGLTTIYRFIDNLVKENIIRKSITNDNTTYYEYLENCEHRNHFYLKCNKCKKTIHIDCDCIETLSNHILDEHKFIPNRNNIIIDGICNNCKRGC